MSNKSTRSLGIPSRISSVIIDGGNDCDTRVVQFPDLYVRGGGRIKKTLCMGLGVVNKTLLVKGDITGREDLCILGSGKVVGDVTTESNVEVGCDLTVEKKSTLKGDVTTKSNLVVEGNITVGCDATVEKTLTAGIIESECLIAANIKCVELISGKSDLTICADGDLYLKPSGNLILDPSAIDFDLTKSVLSNVQAVVASVEPPCHLDLITEDDFKVRIHGGGLDMMGHDICNANVTQTNILSNDGNLLISPDSNLIIDSLNGKTIINDKVCFWDETRFEDFVTINAELCVNDGFAIKTSNITEKVPQQGILLVGNVTMQNNATIVARWHGTQPG